MALKVKSYFMLLKWRGLYFFQQCFKRRLHHRKPQPFLKYKSFLTLLCSYWSISPFATLLLTLFNNLTFSYRVSIFFNKCFQSCPMQIFCMQESLNPFPHIDAFWRLCSRLLFGNIVRKEEIAQNEQFLLLPQCFPLLVFLFFDKICSKSSPSELSYEGKG